METNGQVREMGDDSRADVAALSRCGTTGDEVADEDADEVEEVNKMSRWRCFVMPVGWLSWWCQENPPQQGQFNSTTQMPEKNVWLGGSLGFGLSWPII